MKSVLILLLFILVVGSNCEKEQDEHDEILPLPIEGAPKICLVCDCSIIKRGHNKHYNIKCNDLNTTYELTRQDTWPIHSPVRTFALTHAKLEELPKLPANLTHLHTLSYSHNALRSLPEDAFQNYDLKELNLARNGLKNITDSMFVGNPDLKVLKLQHNEFVIVDWNVINTLENLEELYFQDNYIREFIGTPNLQHLRILNFSGNALDSLPSDMCVGLPALKFFYLANNKFENISSCILDLKELRSLTLNGNPLKKIPENAFERLNNLVILHLQHLIDLVEINSKAFKGLKSLEDIHISYNPRLMSIPSTLLLGGEDSQQHDWKFVNVDISYNSLTKIPKDLAPWELLESLDLQGNPWDCSCENQWMMDKLVPILYSKNSSYLEDARCETPPRFAGKRLVHWLNHTSENGVWCDNKSTKPEPVTQVALQSGSSYGMLIALGVVAIIVLMLIVLGVVLQRRATAQRKALATQQLRCRNPRTPSSNGRLTHPSLQI